MTISLWVSILIAIVAGVFGGVLAPIVSHVLSLNRWKKEKSLDLKFNAFEGALNALAKWEADAMNPELQAQNKDFDGSRPITNLNPSTSEALEHHKGLIEALFSETVANKYKEVLHAHISIKNIPNIEFEQLRSAFVQIGAKELKLKS
ncbi:hypothetical protein [Elongatibacter sediminis]|uniref:Uncharacterized protein n=1 Tax=Elongatibacter sediminis TaxID=3119006 RepID=A0AAW9R9G9_9GAMM